MPGKSLSKSRLSPRSAKPVGSKPAAKRHNAPKKPSRAAKATKAGPTRGEQVLVLLRRPEGATIAEMVKLFGLQPHSVRAVISVKSRKQGVKVELIGRAHYRIEND